MFFNTQKDYGKEIFLKSVQKWSSWSKQDAPFQKEVRVVYVGGNGRTLVPVTAAKIDLIICIFFSFFQTR